MHGIVFTSFRHFALSRYGAGVTADVWAGEPSYLITRAYPDDAFTQLVTRLAEAVGADRETLVRDFGSFAGERTFVLLYPSAYEEAGSARAFLLGVEARIHELVRSTVPDAEPPELEVEPLGEDGVRIRYRSERRLCALLEGLVRGTAAHFGERPELRHERCMHGGEQACVVDVRLAS